MRKGFRSTISFILVFLMIISIINPIGEVFVKAADTTYKINYTDELVEITNLVPDLRYTIVSRNSSGDYPTKVSENSWNYIKVIDNKGIIDISNIGYNSQKAIALSSKDAESKKVPVETIIPLNLAYKKIAFYLNPDVENENTKFLINGTEKGAETNILTKIELTSYEKNAKKQVIENTSINYTNSEITMSDGSKLKIQWRKNLNGSWKELSLLTPDIVRLCSLLGTNIYFRIAPTDSTISNSTINNNVTTIICDGNPASMAVKTSVAKQANAPSISVNLSKTSVNISNGMEYSIDKNIWTKILNYAKTPKNETQTSTRITALLMNDIKEQFKKTPQDSLTLYVRKSATEKKASSKIKKLVLPVQEFLNDSNINISGNLVSGVKLQISDASSGNCYQYCLVAKDKELDLLKQKWTDVKTSKLINIKASSIKNKNIYIRLKQTKTQPASEYQGWEVTNSSVDVITDIICSEKSGIYLFSDDTKNIPVTLSSKSGNAIIYTIDGTEPSISDNGSITNGTAYTSPFNIVVNEGTINIKAMSYKLDNGSVASRTKVRTVTIKFVQSGDTSPYTSKSGYTHWGYQLCQSEGTNIELAYQRIYDSYKAYKSNVDLSDLNISKKDIGKITERVRYDNPALLQIKGGCKYTYDASTNTISNLEIKFLQNQSETEKMLSECEATFNAIKTKIDAENLVADTPQNKVRIVKIIHDYLVTNKDYKKSNYDQTMYGIMSSKSNNNATPVCMSYALALEYCCQKLKIQCILVTGNAGGAHAWNIINYGQHNSMNTNDWYVIDMTWDDPTNMGDNFISYSYFNVTTASFNGGRTRSKDVYTLYPVDSCTGTEYSAINMGYTDTNAINETNFEYGRGLETFKPKVA